MRAEFGSSPMLRPRPGAVRKRAAGPRLGPVVEDVADLFGRALVYLLSMLGLLYVLDMIVAAR